MLVPESNNQIDTAVLISPLLKCNTLSYFADELLCCKAHVREPPPAFSICSKAPAAFSSAVSP